VKAEFVLDATALLRMLLAESGLDRVHAILDRSSIHAVNLAEVLARLVRSGMPAEKAVAALDALYLDVEEEFGRGQAEFCGTLLGTRLDLGLSLGDGVCLATAALSGAVAATSDRRWKELEGMRMGEHTLRVELIR
jgi:ribonuclease VapC